MNFKRLFISFMCCLFIGACFCVYASEKDNVKNINNSIVRFHIRANSNSEYDQDIKMAARKYFFENFKPEIDKDKNSVLVYFKENEKYIEKQINNFLEKQNTGYKCDLIVKSEFFPVREYADFTLPSGIYDAVIINLGEGKGENFFCVMYPSLCMLDGITQTTDEKFTLLNDILDENEIKMITSTDDKTVVKFKIIEIFNKFF